MQRFMEWRQQLGRAASHEAIDGIIRAYLEAIGPSISSLPPACQAVLRDEPDVHDAAVTLLQEELRFEGPEEVRALLQEIAYTLAAGSIRAAALPDAARPARHGVATRPD
jgi:hypothetical protein